MFAKLKVLVLNNSFEPLHFCVARRAIVMVITGRAQQVECDGFMIRSFRASFACPTVIRLNRYIRIPNFGGVSFSKKNVLRRDRKTCQYCGSNHTEMTIDHIIPRSQGGRTEWLNVVAACRKCNLKKGSRSPDDSGMNLIREPFKPKFMAVLSQPTDAPNSFSEAWKKYLSSYAFNS